MLQSASAAGSSGSFVEFHVPGGPYHPGGQTDVFDLDTVHMTLPGKFTMVETIIDDPERVALQLNILDVLRPYCARPDARYPAPQKLLSMLNSEFAPDIIEVNDAGIYKALSWSYIPMTGWNVTSLQCRTATEREDHWYLRQRSLITDGLKIKAIFDCKRGLSGFFLKDTGSGAPSNPVAEYLFTTMRILMEMVARGGPLDLLLSVAKTAGPRAADPLPEFITLSADRGSQLEVEYLGVCQRVMREVPFSPN
jgi:hypothetical protein